MQVKYLTLIEPENIADKFSVTVLNGQVIIYLHHSILFEDIAMSMMAKRVTYNYIRVRIQCNVII